VVDDIRVVVLKVLVLAFTDAVFDEVLICFQFVSLDRAIAGTVVRHSDAAAVDGTRIAFDAFSAEVTQPAS
jgi:hypothetical protein